MPISTCAASRFVKPFHANDVGYVLKRDQVKEEKDTISLEELIESERAALPPTSEKVTLETFLQWKKKKLQEKKEALAAERAKKKKNMEEGKMSKVRSIVLQS